MGFRKDTYATVWSVEPVSDTFTKGRISISRKDRQSGEYVQDFSGFVSFVGSACAKKAAGLKERDRIRLGDVDVTTRYDKQKNATYTNFLVFSFDKGGEQGSGSQTRAVYEDGSDGELPF